MQRLQQHVLRGLAVAGALASAGAASAQEKAPLVVRAETCLRQNVDRVVAADPSMESAASFLVNFACAGEVAAVVRYERNTAFVKLFSTVLKAVPQGAGAAGAKPATPAVSFNATVDPETGDLALPPPAAGAPASPLTAFLPQFSSVMSSFAPDQVPISMRKLAGDLVMEAHEKRRGAR